MPKDKQKSLAIRDRITRKKLNSEQISEQLGLSNETIYKYVYADKSQGGDLYCHLRCQKKRRKRYAGGRDQRGQIIGPRPISEHTSNVEKRSRVGPWKDNMLIGRGNKQAIVRLVERKSGYAILKKASRKTSHLVRCANIKGIKPIAKKDNFKKY